MSRRRRDPAEDPTPRVPLVQTTAGRGAGSTLVVIEDSPSHRADLRRAFEQTDLFDHIAEAGDGIEGLKLMLSRTPDAVVCDLEMPGLDGEKLLAAKQQRPEVRDVPIVFVSASCDPERKARLLERGASDTVEKPFHPAELVARVALHVRLQRLQAELREKNEILARLSTTDSLTGLRNRRYVDEFLTVEFLRARRYGNALAVVMADLDHFKRVNDTHGHPAGDAVLCHVGALLRSMLRMTDVAARYGGEEFVLVLPQNELEGAGVLAERWRAVVEATPTRLPDGQLIEVTLSAGVAAIARTDSTPEDLVAAADEALYRAKEGGRNRVELHRR
jgi:diguanylate cyclase (GGDEF)-like protein